MASKVDELVERANQLLDNPDDFREAQALLEQALTKAPNHLAASYYLAWKLAHDEDRNGHDPARRARIGPLLDAVRAQTAGLEPGEDTVPSRARAFSLAWPLARRAVCADLDEAKRLALEAEQAFSLKGSPLTRAAKRAAKMGIAWAAARAAGDLPKAYRQLLGWVATHPFHSAWCDDDDDEEFDEEDCPSCAGLQPFFDDPGYVAWVRSQRPKARRHPPKLLAKGMLAASGADIHEDAYGAVDPPDAGRRGRILSLLAIGAPLDALSDEGEGVICVAASNCGLDLVRFLIECGSPLDGKGKRVPLVQLARDGDERGVRVLLEAGANPEARGDTNREKRVTALEVARLMKYTGVMKILGATRPKGGLETKSLRTLLKKRRSDFERAKWCTSELSHFDRFFEAVDFAGPKQWTDVAEHLEILRPHELLALTLLLREAVEPSAPNRLGRKDFGRSRIVLGDALIAGDGLFGAGANCVITGDLKIGGRLANDETTRIAVGGNLRAEVIETEGDLWIGGDAIATTSAKAEYEAGSFVVVGTLKTPRFTQKDHVVVIGKRAQR